MYIWGHPAVIWSCLLYTSIADTVLILFPADSVYTQTFEDFLNKNAARFMKHAVLMITMMDRVQELSLIHICVYCHIQDKGSAVFQDGLLYSCHAACNSSRPDVGLYTSAKLGPFKYCAEISGA